MGTLSSEPSINFIPARCPNCGGELRVPENRDSVKCMYCGNDILIHDKNHLVIETKLNIDRYLDLARTSEEAHNYAEAYRYYSQVLEQDSNIASAWVGKGIAAGRQSVVGSERISEAITCIQRGVEIDQNERDRSAINLSHITFAYSSSLETYFSQKMEQNLRPAGAIPDPMMGGLALGMRRSATRKGINEEFRQSHRPIIIKALKFSWHLSNNRDVAKYIYKTIKATDESTYLEPETKDAFEEKLDEILDQIGNKFPDLEPPSKNKPIDAGWIITLAFIVIFIAITIINNLNN